MPVMPAYLLEKLHGSLQSAGAVNAAFLLTVVCFRSQTVRFEARYGVRTVLLGSCFLFMLTNLIYPFVATAAGVLAVRALSGALFGLFNTSLMALGSRMIPAQRKGEGLAYLTTTLITGGAIGPYLGLTLSHSFGYRTVFVFSALVTLLGLLVVCCVPVSAERPQISDRFSVHDLFELKAIPVSILILLLGFAYGAVLTFVVLYANELKLFAAARYFFVSMASACVISRLLTGRVYDRFGPNVAVNSAILVLTAGMLTLGLSRSAPVLLIAAALVGMGHGMGVPSVHALSIQLSPQHRTSAVTATFFTFLDGGIGLGAYLLGGSIHAFGFAPVYLALGAMTLSCLLYFYAVYTRGTRRGSRRGEPCVRPS